MRLFAGVVTLSVIPLFNCTIDNNDRCPGDLSWDSENYVCRSTSETNRESDSNTGQRTDAGQATDTGDALADVPSGMGELCKLPEDCAPPYEANYCMVNPISEEGRCTIENCSPDECPDSYVCCDCSDFSSLQVVACVPVDVAEDILIPIGGCPCS